MVGLAIQYGPTVKTVGDGGGFLPPCDSTEQVVQLIEEAIAAAGLKAGVDIAIYIDVAAARFYDADAEVRAPHVDYTVLP